MRPRILMVEILCGVIVVSGCGSSGTPRADPTPSVSSPSSTKADPAAPDTSSATEDLLLARQVQLQEGGDGLGPSCRMDEETPDEFRRDPGVWLNNLFSPTDYPGVTVLCLRGFEPSQPIEVVTTSGDIRVQTRVQPVLDAPTSDSPLGYDDEAPTTLFEEQAELPVYTQQYGGGAIEGPPGAMVSEMWQFLPPARVRDELADAGSLTVSAEQGDLRASMRVPIPVPAEREHYQVGPVGDSQLAVVGYPAGARVPIGVYRQGGSGPEVPLVRQIASVTMPASRVASLPLRQELLRDVPEANYCVMPPVTTPPSCAEFTKWPEYPGQVLPGDRGPDVERWQGVLILARVMSDITGNRDGFYGPATVRTLREFLRNGGATNPDGGDTLGPGLYTQLTGEQAGG